MAERQRQPLQAVLLGAERVCGRVGQRGEQRRARRHCVDCAPEIVELAQQTGPEGRAGGRVERLLQTVVEVRGTGRHAVLGRREFGQAGLQAGVLLTTGLAAGRLARPLLPGSGLLGGPGLGGQAAEAGLRVARRLGHDLGEVGEPAGVPQDRRDLQEHGVHDVIGVQLRIKDQMGGITHLPVQRHREVDHTGVVGKGRSAGLLAPDHGQDPLPQLGPALGGLQRAAVLPVDRVDGADGLRHRGGVNPRPAHRRGLLLGEQAEHVGERAEVLHPEPLVGGGGLLVGRRAPEQAETKRHRRYQHDRHRGGNGHSPTPLGPAGRGEHAHPCPLVVTRALIGSPPVAGAGEPLVRHAGGHAYPGAASRGALRFGRVSDV